MRGDIQIGVESYAALKSPIDAGSIRAIAGSGSKRSPMQPNVPTLHEHGVDAEVDGWNSLVAPAGTPKEIIDMLNGHIRAVVEGDDFKRRMLDLGGEPKPSTPEELAARLKSDIEMWAAVVKKAGLDASLTHDRRTLKIDAHVHVFTTDMPLIDNPRHAPNYSFTYDELIATLDSMASSAR